MKLPGLQNWLDVVHLFGWGGAVFWNTERSTQVIVVFPTGDGSKAHQFWVPADTGPFLAFKWDLE